MATYHPALRRLLSLTPQERRRAIKSLSPRDRLRLVHDWKFWGRAEQQWEPGNAIHTFYLSGRGWGKTRTGAEIVRKVASRPWLCGGRRPRNAYDRDYGVGGWIGIAGRTANDVNETMLFGESGLMNIGPPEERPRYIGSRKRLVWPNGVVARLMSGDTPDSFRGPNFGFLWTDELCYWRKLSKCLSVMRMTHRHGRNPRAVHTTTPLGIPELIGMLFQLDETGQPLQAMDGDRSLQGLKLRDRVDVIVGSTYDNAANLASDYMEETVGEYAGTEEGAQEIEGMILFDVAGAPWKREWIQRCEEDDVPELVSIVIGVDPTVSDGEKTASDEACECGIVVVGVCEKGDLYLLEDLSGVMSTSTWGNVVAQAYKRWDADLVCVEDNNGGELVETVIRMGRNRVKIQRCRAGRNKYTRAGLVSPVWEHRRAYHVGHPRRWVRLEHQQCTFDPKKNERAQLSDRMDALVWAVLGALGDGTDRSRIRGLSNAAAWNKIRQRLSG